VGIIKKDVEPLVRYCRRRARASFQAVCCDTYCGGGILYYLCGGSAENV